MRPLFQRVVSWLAIAVIAALSGYYLADVRSTNSLISNATQPLKKPAGSKSSATLGGSVGDSDPNQSVSTSEPSEESPIKRNFNSLPPQLLAPTWRVDADQTSENRKAVITPTNKGARYRPSISDSEKQSEAAEPYYRKLNKFLEDGEKRRSLTIQVMQRNNGEVLLFGIAPPSLDEAKTAAGILRNGLQKVSSDSAPYLLVAGQKLLDEYLNVSGLYRVIVISQEYQSLGANEPPQPKVLFTQFFAPNLDGIKLNSSGIVESPHSNSHGETETIWGELANIPQRFRHLVVMK